MEIVCSVHEINEGGLFVVNKPDKCFAGELDICWEIPAYHETLHRRSANSREVFLTGMWLSVSSIQSIVLKHMS